MAKTPTAVRTAVAERGVELLKLIAASEGGVLMLTQDEAIEIVQNGFATVDNNVTEGTTAAVSLTEAGQAELNAPATDDSTATAPAATAPASNGFAIEKAVPMPAAIAGRRGRSGGYPFESMEVDDSFHVACFEGKTLDETLTTLSSSVSGARTKFAVVDGDKKESVTVKTYKRGEDGKFLKDGDGKRVVESEATEERPVMKIVRDFKAAKVGTDDPKGAGVRIWRTA